MENTKYQVYTLSYENSVLSLGISGYNEDMNQGIDVLNFNENNYKAREIAEYIHIPSDIVSNFLDIQVVFSGLNIEEAKEKLKWLSSYYEVALSQSYKINPDLEILMKNYILPSEGKVKFITGLMGAGKSAQMIEKFLRPYLKNNSICFSITLDTYKPTGTLGAVESRNGTRLYAINLNIKEDLVKVIQYVNNICKDSSAKAVFIDEIQFAPHEFIEAIINISKNQNVKFYLYGLESTFTGSLFSGSEALLSLLPPKDITHIPMMCQHENCNLVALHNARLKDGKVITSGATVSEEKDQYKALCSIHYHKLQ